MNVRAHGGDGNWRSLARGLTGGYSQVEGKPWKTTTKLLLRKIISHFCHDYFDCCCCYLALEVTVDSYLDKKQFSVIPNLPPWPFKASGQEVILVSFSRGKVVATPVSS